MTRYYDGETSETEEKELKRFFTEEDVPAHLLAEKEIFMQRQLPQTPSLATTAKRELFEQLRNYAGQVKSAKYTDIRGALAQAAFELKQRTEKAARTAGRAPAGSQAHRLVPLSDHQYVSQLQMMVATLKIPLERRNKRTGRMEKARIWEITDRTVRTWLSEAVESAAADGVTFSVPVTPHTFRHSYAMHMLYAGIPLKVLQSLMGHKSISSTEVYTKVFALDVAARHRVQFAMPEAEAVALIKKLTPNQST